MEVIDAPRAGIPARVWRHKQRWHCLEYTRPIVTFAVQDRPVCTLGTFGHPGFPLAIGQLPFEGAARRGLNNSQPRGTPRGSISSRVYKQHLIHLPVLLAFDYWGLCWGEGHSSMEVDLRICHLG